MKHDCGKEDCKCGLDLIKLSDKAFTTMERNNVETIWSELAEFVLQSHYSEFRGDMSKAIKRDQRVFDSTAIVACRDLANAIHGTVTNPTMKWSKLRFIDDDLNNEYAAVAWLDKCTDTIHNYLNESNFDSQAGQSYHALCGLGTFALMHEESTDSNTLFNFLSWHLAEVAFEENKNGVVDCIYRRFKLTASQLYEKFPDCCPEKVCQDAAKDPLKEYEVLHCIKPRAKLELESETLLTPKSRPFASFYMMNTGHILDEDGFYEFPVYIARWSKLPGELYGYGPGHAARPDVRTICAVREESLKMLAKAVNPPIAATQNNIISADLRPGKLTVVRDLEKFKEIVTQGRFDVASLEQKHLTDSIKQAFYLDKLMLPPRTETGEMTAYEISQRLEQMQTVLGPVLSRLNSDFLQKLVMRCLKICSRRSKLPAMPDEVAQILLSKGKNPSEIDLEVTFVNSLARSQQLGELRNVESFVQEMMMMAQANPQVLDKINFDAIVDYAAKIRSIPETIIKSDQEVEAKRQQAMQAQQQAAQLAAAQQVGSTVKDVGSGLGNLGKLGGGSAQ